MLIFYPENVCRLPNFNEVRSLVSEMKHEGEL
jgi:hypothetical protein